MRLHTEVKTSHGEGTSHDTSEDLLRRNMLAIRRRDRWQKLQAGIARGIMTHQQLGVALGLLLELGLLVLLEPTSGGGEESAGNDAGSHCDDCNGGCREMDENRFGAVGLKLRSSRMISAWIEVPVCG